MLLLLNIFSCDQFMLIRGEVWAHKTSLTPPLFIDAPVPNQESVRLYICAIGVSILAFSTICYWISELFPLCSTCFFPTFITNDSPKPLIHSLSHLLDEDEIMDEDGIKDLDFSHQD